MSLMDWKEEEKRLKAQGAHLKDAELKTTQSSSPQETSGSPKKTSTLFGRLLKLLTK